MESAFEEASVTGYECLVRAMTNDPKDRHVLAAAVRRGTHAIVTHNVNHFRLAAAEPYSLDVLTPDDFLVHQSHFNDGLLMEKLVAQAAARGITRHTLFDRLERWAPSAIGLLR